MVARKWNDEWSRWADDQVAVILATVELEPNAQKRLRIAGTLSQQTDRFVAAKRAAIAELREQGLTLAEIGAILGVNRSSIWQTMNRRKSFPKETRNS